MSSFDGVYGGSGLYYPKPTEMLVDYVRERSCAGFALDAGSGDGRNALWLLGQGWHVDAVDKSCVGVDKLTRLAEELSLGQSLRAQCKDLSDFTTYEDGYDLIVASTILCHLPKPVAEHLLNEFRASMRRGAALYVSVFTRDDPSFGDGECGGVAASETADAVINHYGTNELLHSLSDLRIVRYFEGNILDESHGEPHRHGIARAVAVLAD